MRTQTAAQCAQIAANAGETVSLYKSAPRVVSRPSPADELAFWRAPRRRALLLVYLDVRITRIGLRNLRPAWQALRDELAAADDLAVLDAHPDLAPVIVALRGGLLVAEFGSDWAPVARPFFDPK